MSWRALEGDVAKRKISEIIELRPGQSVEEAYAAAQALRAAMKAEREADLAAEREAAQGLSTDPAPDSSEALSIGSPAPDAPEA
jgi:hypothetical protein